MFYFSGNITLKGVLPEQAEQLGKMDHRSLGSFIDKAAILCMTQDKFKSDPIIPDASFSVKNFYIGKKRWALLKPFVDICERVDCDEIPKSMLASIAISRVLNGYFEIIGNQIELNTVSRFKEKERELEELEYPPVSKRHYQINSFNNSDKTDDISSESFPMSEKKSEKSEAVDIYSARKKDTTNNVETNKKTVSSEHFELDVEANGKQKGSERKGNKFKPIENSSFNFLNNQE